MALYLNVYGQALQKCQFLAKNFLFGPKNAIFGPKFLVLATDLRNENGRGGRWGVTQATGGLVDGGCGH